ncbi:MAG: Smr/MutS family protein [Pseudomonadota bacterium]
MHPEEEALWAKIEKTVTPLNPVRKAAGRTAAVAGKPKQGAWIEASAPTSEMDPPAAVFVHDPPPPAMGHRSRSSPIRMDSRIFGRMKRGKMAPEARIDLHGMTRLQAYPALIGFIERSHASGKRLVLVITGRGGAAETKSALERTGVLKRQVPEWLRQGALSSLILQISEAHARHGGGGAYYVYLRRAR